MGDFQKASQIKEDLLELWKCNVENDFGSIASFLLSQSDSTSAFLGPFHNFRTYSLPNLKLEKIEYYWKCIFEMGMMFASNAAEPEDKWKFIETLCILLNFLPPTN